MNVMVFDDVTVQRLFASKKESTFFPLVFPERAFPGLEVLEGEVFSELVVLGLSWRRNCDCQFSCSDLSYV